MIDVILDTLLDTAKLLPFLFLTYLLMEYLEHRSGDATGRLLGRSGRVGPLIGGLLGVVPQCGFSAAAAGLYAGRVITVGTLLSVWLTTSDEMLPILISHGVPLRFLLRFLAVKLVCGIAAGFVTDLVCRLFRREREPSHIEDICEREHCHCGDHFALSALKHTLKIAAFLLVISFALNTLIHFVGEERIAALVLDRPVLGNVLAALVGLIPNCASSVVLTELYLSDVISVGSMLSGLLVNAGVGVLVLFRNNRPVRDSVRVVAILLCVGLLCGILTDLTPLGAWIGRAN